MRLALCLLIILSFFSCTKNYYLEKKSDLFREAIKKPLVEGKNLPILKNKFFAEFTKEDFANYRQLGINIWGKDDLFMRGTSDFISIYEVDLKENLLTINYRYYEGDRDPVEQSLRFQL